MDRVYQANAIETPPSTTASSGSYPTAGNKASGQLATVPGPYWFYSITEEIRNALISAGVTPDAAKVNQLAEALGKFLPLSGGTMSEDAKIGFASYPNIKVGSDGTSVFIGNNGSQGSLARFFDVDFESNPGGYQVRVADGTTSKYMFLKADGTFQWNGHQVERVNSSGDNWIRYENGIQIVWGSDTANSDKTNKTVTLPVAFANIDYAIEMTRISGIDNGTDYAIWLRGNPTTTSFRFYGTASTSMRWLAIGKWK